MKNIKDLIKATRERVTPIFTNGYKKALKDSVRFFLISSAFFIGGVAGSIFFNNSRFVIVFPFILLSAASVFTTIMGISMILDTLKAKKDFYKYEHPGYFFNDEASQYVLTPEENNLLMKIPLNLDQQKRIIDIIEETGQITYLDLFAIRALIDQATLEKEAEEQRRTNFLSYCQNNGLNLSKIEKNYPDHKDLMTEQEKELGDTVNLKKML